MEKVMLSFDKVSAHYGKIQALHEVSLYINCLLYTSTEYAA